MKYELKNDVSKIIVTDEGAMLSSLVKNNTEYLWQGDPKYWPNQAPVCFPICGILRDNKATAFSKECNMNRHGIARDFPFTVKSQYKNSITFEQNGNDQTKKLYPFDYNFQIKYTLNDSTVTVEYMVTNSGTDDLPFTLGGHPAFNCPLDSDEKFEEYKINFDKKMTKSVLRPNHITGIVDVTKRDEVLENDGNITLSHDLFEEKNAMIFDNIESKSATLIGKNNKGIKVDFEDFNNLLIWSACNNAPFVAIEPWNGISCCTDEDNTLENKRGMTILKSNEVVSFKYKITMI